MIFDDPGPTPFIHFIKNQNGTEKCKSENGVYQEEKSYQDGNEELLPRHSSGVDAGGRSGGAGRSRSPVGGVAEIFSVNDRIATPPILSC